MTEIIVGGVYEGIGNRLWTITGLVDEDTELPWIVAVVENGGSVQFPAREIGKWFFRLIGDQADKVASLDDRQKLRVTLEARDRLNRLIARQAKAVQQ